MFSSTLCQEMTLRQEIIISGNVSSSPQPYLTETLDNVDHVRASCVNKQGREFATDACGTLISTAKQGE